MNRERGLETAVHVLNCWTIACQRMFATRLSGESHCGFELGRDADECRFDSSRQVGGRLQDEYLATLDREGDYPIPPSRCTDVCTS